MQCTWRFGLPNKCVFGCLLTLHFFLILQESWYYNSFSCDTLNCCAFRPIGGSALIAIGNRPKQTRTLLTDWIVLINIVWIMALRDFLTGFLVKYISWCWHAHFCHKQPRLWLRGLSFQSLTRTCEHTNNQADVTWWLRPSSLSHFIEYQHQTIFHF